MPKSFIYRWYIVTTESNHGIKLLWMLSNTFWTDGPSIAEPVIATITKKQQQNKKTSSQGARLEIIALPVSY